jgi:DNA-3-methyladenine glycosylase I
VTRERHAAPAAATEPPPSGLGNGPDGELRCAWCLAAPEYVAYHDTEWGFPQEDDVRLFEKICLEGFQSGLSWLTILRKREAFRRGSLAAYYRRFEPDPASRPARITWAVLRGMAVTAESKALAADLRRRGWSFVGPTTMYAFMQGVGVVNDHVEGCFCRPEVEALRQKFRRPKS